MGRSGSSIIFDTFMQGMDCAFMSQYNTNFIKYPQITFIHNIVNKYRPKVSKKNKIMPTAKEAYIVWNFLCDCNFSQSFLRGVQATNVEIQKIRKYIKRLLFWQRKTRFATKLTGPPRIEFLSSIFKDAIFIDVIREPRAVVNSLLNVKFRIKKGLEKPYWVDSLGDKEILEWKSYDFSALSLAALEWRAVYNLTKIEINKINPKYLQIKYENFVNDPKLIVNKILKFVGLNYSKSHDKFIENTHFLNQKSKYLNNLSKKEINIINSICGIELSELGYA